MLRGEFLRVFLGGNTPVALATNCSLHLSLSMEDATTKDDTSSSGGQALTYKSQVPTVLSYDLSCECLYSGGLSALEEGTVYQWDLATASGEGQQQKGSSLASGNAMLTSLVANAPVNQNITYQATFTGVGVLNSSSTNSN